MTEEMAEGLRLHQLRRDNLERMRTQANKVKWDTPSLVDRVFRRRGPCHSQPLAMRQSELEGLFGKVLHTANRWSDMIPQHRGLGELFTWVVVFELEVEELYEALSVLDDVELSLHYGM